MIMKQLAGRIWDDPYQLIALSSTYQFNVIIPDDKLPTSALNPIISLLMVQDIWIHRWIDDDNLKMQLMDIRNILAERTMVEYYIDDSLRPNTFTTMGKQDPNLVYTDMGAAFCINNEPALSAQVNVSLWPSSTHSELVSIFLALFTGPINAKIKIYTNNLVLVKVKRHSGDVMNEMVDDLAKNTSNSR
ncbi:hypothetical protein GLOIN_2v1788498 [Rhizophagus irregularis DAOM 181602=DAOM 197198]|nr:hypothetical protein GLOIN_2v1788498 [Rhizophagus irregularis DAOM 181602=DAOM 197198]